MSKVKSFSVGNGDMFYIKHNSDNFTTIDCCLNYDADAKKAKEHVLSELRSEMQDKQIKRFISTHPDEDHISGLEEYDDEFEILNFYRVDNEATKKEQESDDFKRYKKLRNDSKKQFELKKDCSRKWMNQPSEERGSSGLFCLWPITDNKYLVGTWLCVVDDYHGDDSAQLTLKADGEYIIKYLDEYEDTFMGTYYVSEDKIFFEEASGKDPIGGEHQIEKLTSKEFILSELFDGLKIRGEKMKQSKVVNDIF